jgi:hypothetical protein
MLNMARRHWEAHVAIDLYAYGGRLENRISLGTRRYVRHLLERTHETAGARSCHFGFIFLLAQFLFGLEDGTGRYRSVVVGALVFRATVSLLFLIVGAVRRA